MAMIRPTSRVLALLEILQAGGTRQASDLAERLGVDERTVRRYVQHLVDLDVPVRSLRGRFGGYRLEPGYRLPPLMLTDDEAVAVLLGLLVGRRAGLVPRSAATESALAKLRRVLPLHLRDRLEALLAVVSFTAPTPDTAPVDPAALLTLAQATHQGATVEIGYADRLGRTSTRTIRPQGLVGHSGRWYVTTTDRTFRLDRVTAARQVQGDVVPAGEADAATQVLASLARAPWAHEIVVRVHGDVDTVQRRLPLGLAVVTPDGHKWVRVELHAEQLDWVPAILAGMNLPFEVERPEELRAHVHDLAQRLEHWAAAHPQPRA